MLVNIYYRVHYYWYCNCNTICFSYGKRWINGDVDAVCYENTSDLTNFTFFINTGARIRHKMYNSIKNAIYQVRSKCLPILLAISSFPVYVVVKNVENRFFRIQSHGEY